MRTKINLMALMLIFFSGCSPDEDDTYPNSSNNGGSSNTSSAASYPNIVNMLAVNWYGQSIVAHFSDGTQQVQDSDGTFSQGYITFSSTSNGYVNYTDETGFLSPSFENLLVKKYPVSVTITDGSWDGFDSEVLGP